MLHERAQQSCISSLKVYSKNHVTCIVKIHSTLLLNRHQIRLLHINLLKWLIFKYVRRKCKLRLRCLCKGYPAGVPWRSFHFCVFIPPMPETFLRAVFITSALPMISNLPVTACIAVLHKIVGTREMKKRSNLPLLYSEV